VHYVYHAGLETLERSKFLEIGLDRLFYLVPVSNKRNLLDLILQFSVLKPCQAGSWIILDNTLAAVSTNSLLASLVND
jgi:hypothetical protein